MQVANNTTKTIPVTEKHSVLVQVLVTLGANSPTKKLKQTDFSKENEKGSQSLEDIPCSSQRTCHIGDNVDKNERNYCCCDILQAENVF